MRFAKALTKAMKKGRLTPYQLSQAAHVDYKHVRRLISGEATNPSRDLILRLGQALLDNSGAMSLDDVDRLLTTAGKGPLRRERIVIDHA